MNTICFAAICKNNGKNIITTLEKIYKIIDYWVILDVGSTDETCNLIIDFFKEKNILGELIKKRADRVDICKTFLFEKCYKKSDFILHIDVDDEIVLPKEIVDNDTFHIVFGLDKKNIIGYNANVYEKNEIIDCKISNNDESEIITKSRNIIHKKTILFNNHYKWKSVGVYNPKMICMNIDELENSNIIIKDFYVCKNTNKTGNFKETLKILEEQYNDTLIIDEYNLHSYSIFHIAQIYYNNKMWKDALHWYLRYTKLSNVDQDELFEVYIKITQILYVFDYSINTIIKYIARAISIYNDRAEPYYYIGRIFNQHTNYEMGYFNLKKAHMKEFDKVLETHSRFIDEDCYANGLYDDLILSCKNTGRKEDISELEKTKKVVISNE
jgi:tetratricopeptide (TPR) repeat protein